MSRQNTDFWVGLFVLLGGCAVVFLALQAGNLSSLSLSRHYLVTATFDNVGGLKKHAAVKSAGVVVGRVNQIDFNTQTFQATVTLSLDTRYHFPQDTSAAIQTAGLLGDQYVGLTAGSDDTNVDDGGKFQYTQSAIILENLISQFLYGSAAKKGAVAPGK